MNTHVIVALDTRYKKKNGSFNICIQLVRGGKNGSQMIPTGISVPLNDWDLKKRKVKDSYKDVTSVPKLNRQIDDKKKEANDILIELDE